MQKFKRRNWKSGAKLVSKINNPIHRNAARKSYINILKSLKIVPEAVAFYDNFDFVGKGKLKSEPFRPSSWSPNKAWIAEANLASINIDLNARQGKLEIKGNILSSLRIFNNDILKADHGLINAGLTIDLKQDGGSLHLDQIELRLPGDLASVAANAHFTHLFNPSKLSTWGNIRGGLKVFNLELAEAGAGYRFDPNAQYSLDDYTTKGLLQLDAKIKLAVLLAEGKAVFTLPNDQLAIDIGGSLDLNFLGYNKQIAEAIGRARIGNDELSFCFNAQTGKIDMTVPFGIGNISLQGGLSFEGKIDHKKILFAKLRKLMLSGQGNNNSRIGFQYDPSNGYLKAFSRYNKKCQDAPGEEFLQKTIAQLPPIDHSLNTKVVHSNELRKNYIASANPSPQIIAQALEQENEEIESSFSAGAMWDVTGWRMIKVNPESGGEIIFLDSSGKEVSLNDNDFSVPGIWPFSDPPRYLIVSQEEFDASGHQIALKKTNSLPISLSIGYYSNEEEVILEFNVDHLRKTINEINLEQLEDQKISINNTVIFPSESTKREIKQEERVVKAEVSTIKDENPTQPKSNPPLEKATNCELRTADCELPTAPLFPDIRSSILREAVTFLAKRNVINGYPDNTFRPDQTINRAEALKIIFAALGTTPNKQTTSQKPFSDVPTNKWFTPYVLTAKERDIIQGYPDGSFRPAQEINKVEFIKMTMSAQDFYLEPINNQPALEKYSDLDPSAWYLPYISFSVLNNFLDNSEKLHPRKGMSRGEAALILYKILQHREQLASLYLL